LLYTSEECKKDRPKCIQYLEENLGALNVSFTKEELNEISNIFPKGIAEGLQFTLSINTHDFKGPNIV
jgi:hypothetical protein